MISTKCAHSIFMVPKSMAGIAPSGIVTFILSTWGHIPDKKKKEWGLIDLLESGDVVMFDRGFDIQHLLASKCEKSAVVLKRK